MPGTEKRSTLKRQRFWVSYETIIMQFNLSEPQVTPQLNVGT